MGDLVPRTGTTQHRELTPDEIQAHVDAAFVLERKIKVSYAHVHVAWWALSEQLYQFHEGGYWSALGYETLDEFLAQPDLGLSRRQFFRMTKIWRDLVVVRQIDPEKLAEIEPSKMREVAPAIMRGDVSVDDAIDDAKSLGYRDVRAKYRPGPDQGGQKPNDSTTLAAEDEPVRVQCLECGSWYVPTQEDRPADV